MLGFSKKFFVALVLGCINFLASAEVPQKEFLEKFLATTNVQVVQKENSAQELLNLFDKIVEGLIDGGERLSKITIAFYDLCAILGKIDEPRPHHIRELETKLEEIYVLISNDADISPTERVVLGNISSFINLFEVLLNSENLNLGGAAAKFVDLFFYKPLEFINQFKYGPEIAATTATVVVAGLGSVIAWKVGKKKEAATNVVEPITSATTSEDNELEMQDFVSLASHSDASSSGDSVETAPNALAVNPTIDLTVPSSESGVDAQATQVMEESEDVKEQEGSKPTLERQDAVGNLQSLITEVAAPIATQDNNSEKKFVSKGKKPRRGHNWSKRRK